MLVQNLIRFCLKRSLQFLGAFLLTFLLNVTSLEATPQLSLYDPAVIHTVHGTDKFYKERNKAELTLHFVPFFQHTVTASQQVGDNFLNGDDLSTRAANLLRVDWCIIAIRLNGAINDNYDDNCFIRF